jgi:hypothetical protein
MFMQPGLEFKFYETHAANEASAVLYTKNLL